ncbi:hypothetical protein D3C81_1727150 [compost metagenome]
MADPYADPDLHGLAIDHEGGPHGVPDHLGHILRLGAAVAGQQQDEFIPRQPGKIALVTDGVMEPVGQLAEDGVPLAVAEVVIDALEVIEIAKQQAARILELHLLLQLLHQAKAIGQACERIYAGQLQYLLLAQLAQCHLPIEPLVADQQIEGEQQDEGADPQAQQEPGAPEDPLR